MAELRVPYLNSVIVIGRVTMDPDLRYTPRGTPVLTFRIALNRRYRVNEEWKDETYFFTVTTWAQLAERLGDRLKKGAAIVVQGELRSRSWETQTGERRSVVEILARSVTTLEKTGLPETAQAGALPEPDASGPAVPPEEEPDIPRDQLDDIPF